MKPTLEILMFFLFLTLIAIYVSIAIIAMVCSWVITVRNWIENLLESLSDWHNAFQGYE